ncbi:MAG: 6-carboxytetrahydropterin synthase [Pseudomonadota bacterium]
MIREYHPYLIQSDPVTFEPMYQVTKAIYFCYGHRLLDYAGKCRHLHGHNARAVITFRGEHLDERGMLYDFNDIKDLVKGWIDENLDHNMLLRADDPLIPLLENQGERFLAVENNPTAEHIAKMIHDFIIAEGYPVAEVAVWETETCIASYSSD